MLLKMPGYIAEKTLNADLTFEIRHKINWINSNFAQILFPRPPQSGLYDCVRLPVCFEQTLAADSLAPSAPEPGVD